MTESTKEAPAVAADTMAFEILVREHHRRLLAFAQSLVGDDAGAEDIVQDAFVTAYQKLPSFKLGSDFGAWLRSIIRFKALEWRRARRERQLDEAVLERLDHRHAMLDQAAQDGRDVKNDLFASLRTCLERLAELPRAAIEFFYFKNYSCAEIADHTGVSTVTVRKRLQRARMNLAQCIKESVGLNSSD